MTFKWLGIRKDKVLWQVTEIPKIERALPDRKGNRGIPGLVWQCLTHGQCSSWFLICLPSSTLQCLFLCLTRLLEVQSSYPHFGDQEEEKRNKKASSPYGYFPGISQILPTFHWPGLSYNHTALQCDLYFVPSHDQLIFRGSITEEREGWYWRTPNSLCCCCC